MSRYDFQRMVEDILTAGAVDAAGVESQPIEVPQGCADKMTRLGPAIGSTQTLAALTEGITRDKPRLLVVEAFDGDSPFRGWENLAKLFRNLRMPSPEKAVILFMATRLPLADMPRLFGEAWRIPNFLFFLKRIEWWIVKKSCGKHALLRMIEGRAVTGPPLPYHCIFEYLRSEDGDPGKPNRHIISPKPLFVLEPLDKDSQFDSDEDKTKSTISSSSVIDQVIKIYRSLPAISSESATANATADAVREMRGGDSAAAPEAPLPAASVVPAESAVPAASAFPAESSAPATRRDLAERFADLAASFAEALRSDNRESGLDNIVRQVLGEPGGVRENIDVLRANAQAAAAAMEEERVFRENVNAYIGRSEGAIRELQNASRELRETFAAKMSEESRLIADYQSGKDKDSRELEEGMRLKSDLFELLAKIVQKGITAKHSADNLIENLPADIPEDEFVRGEIRVLNKSLCALLDLFESFGEIGEPFDATRHEWINGGLTANMRGATISRIVRRGFAFKGQVIRNAEVDLSPSPPSGGQGGAEAPS